MIELRSKDGFVVRADPARITAYGMEPAAPARVWIMVDGREYSSSTDPDLQLASIDAAVKKAQLDDHFKIRGPGGSA